MKWGNPVGTLRAGYYSGLCTVFHLLVVDDDPGDTELFRHLIKTLKRPHEAYFVTDGTDALDFLYCRGPYADAPRPNLILLDMNMPGMDGIEVLTRIRADHLLRLIPVIIFSSSGASEDVRRAYEVSANCYVQKPTSIDRAHKFVQAIEAFWMEFAIVPPCDESKRPNAVLLI